MTHVDEKIGISLIATILMVVGFLFLTPAAFWFRVDKLDVQNADSWQHVIVDFDRTISRDFQGAWRIEVRHETAPDSWEAICGTDWQPQDYLSNAALPQPVTLEWLTYIEPRCYELTEPGRYRIDVTWRINPGSVIFERRVRRSDLFVIFGEAA